MKLRCLDLDSPHLQPEVAAKAEAELVNWDMVFGWGKAENGRKVLRNSGVHMNRRVCQIQ